MSTAFNDTVFTQIQGNTGLQGSQGDTGTLGLTGETGIQGTTGPVAPSPNSIAGMIEAPITKSYMLDLSCPTSFTINSMTVTTSSGSCVVSLGVSGINVGGLGGVSVTTDRQTVNASSPNTVSVGQPLYLGVTGGALPVDLMFSIDIDRISLDSFAGMIEAPATKNYMLDLSCSTSFTINSMTVMTSSGSCVVSLGVSGTNVGGLEGISVTTARQTVNASSPNTVSVGQPFYLGVTGGSLPVDLMFSIDIHRTS